MSNVVPCIERPSGFLTVGEVIPIPPIQQFKGLELYPPWIHFWPEVRNAFGGFSEKNTGGIVVAPCACGSGWKRGWDMNLHDLLRFAQGDRTARNSWLTLGEVLYILGSDRLGSLEQYLPSPFYFIVVGWGKEPRLLEVRRTNQYGYRIDGSSEVAKNSRIPRQKPLFIPGLARRSL
jgi:hypothetical protein